MQKFLCAERRGGLRPDFELKEKLPLTKKKKISIRQWEEKEPGLLREVSEGSFAFLEGCAFPDLRGIRWPEAAEEMNEGADEGSFGSALRFFAGWRWLLIPQKVERLILLDLGRAASTKQKKEQRSHENETRFLEIGLRMKYGRSSGRSAERGSWRGAIWATRLRIAQTLADVFEQEGSRGDRAAAEAVMIVDTIGDSEWWSDIRESIVV